MLGSRLLSFQELPTAGSTSRADFQESRNNGSMEGKTATSPLYRCAVSNLVTRTKLAYRFVANALVIVA